MLIDSHCHLTSNYLTEGELDKVLNRAYECGVTGFIAVGTNIYDCNLALDLTKQHQNIQTCLGVHPHDASTWNADCEQKLSTMLGDPNVRFVGETGLDWHYNLSPQSDQIEAFRQQIQLAKKYKKPLMIHTRKAPKETIDILLEEGADKVGGIIHCFSEDREFARKALDLNFYLSFSGILTFKNTDSIRDVATWAPQERILIETDAPYLAPHPHRGKTNEPALLIHTLECLAQLRNTTPKQLAAIMANNLETLCGWPSLL